MSATFLSAAEARAATGGAPRSTAVLYDAAEYPLLAAAEAGDKAAVARLLNAGADANQRTRDGWTPMIMAAKEGHQDVIMALMMADAEVNPPGRSEPGFVPSHTALRGAAMNGRAGCVQMLLENEADPNQVSAENKTPLMGAAMNGHSDVVELLLENGALPMTVNRYGETAKMLAEGKGHAGIADTIRRREGVPLSGAGSAGLTPGQAADMLAGYLEASQIS